MKPSNRPWTDHPFQTCRDGIYSSYQTSSARMELCFQEMKCAGVQIARFELPWLNIEQRVHGLYDWQRTDQIMKLFELYDIEPLPILLSSSLAAGSGLTPRLHPACAPDLIDFSLAFLARYGAQVRYLEIGNEPNQVYFVEDFGWGRPHDKFFTELLVPVAVAIKQAHPNIKILNGGEFRQLPDFLFWNSYIPALGRRVVPLDCIDVFSVHYVEQVSELAAMRARLDAAGYQHIPIWLTECDYYDRWGAMPNGFNALVGQAWPAYVEGFFDYTDFDGYQYHCNQSTGLRSKGYDDGGILGVDFNRNVQAYQDFTSVSGGPFSIDTWAPPQGVAFAGFDVDDPAPGSNWSWDFPIFNLGRRAHQVDLRYSGAAIQGPSSLALPGTYGQARLSFSGTMPAAGDARILILARSQSDGRFADMNRLFLRGSRGAVLNRAAQYAPEYIALFDENASSTKVLDGMPEVVEMSWPHPVCIEQIEILTAAGDLVDTASSFVDFEFWDGRSWLSLGSLFAREGREASGPEDFLVTEDGEALPALPFNAERIRLTFWQKTRLATINIRGELNPGNSPPRCHLRSYTRVLPGSGRRIWGIEGWIHDPDGLFPDLVSAALEWNGPNDVLLDLHILQFIVGPLPFFYGASTSTNTYRFVLENSIGLGPERQSFLLRVRDRSGRADMSLVTVGME